MDRSSQPPTVRVRSQRPANDPIVQILVDARFASGRVLREYTLFLDPPTVDAPPPVRRAPEEVAERPPEPARTEPAPREEPPARTPRAADPDPADERPRVADGTVSVARGDTLWGIGYNWRPDPGLSMDQVMLAIFERNRHAFMGENINRLRSGAELTMPSVDEVRNVSGTEAEQRVREHMQAWQQVEPAREVPVVADAGVPEADPVEEADPEPAEPEVAHRLDVVPPEDDEFADGPAVSDGEIRRIQGALAEVEDEILSEQLESPGFEEQIAEIRDALESRDMAGVAFAEESLAELEARLREARQERAEAEAEAAADEDDEVVAYFDELERELIGETDEPMPVPDEDPAVAQLDEAVDPDDEVAPAEEAVPAEQPAQPITTTGTPAGFLGLALWQWLALAVVLILLVAGAVLYLVRRRNAGDGDRTTVATVGDAEANARKTIARKPGDLAAHLALLKLLADQDDETRFSDAIDEMYQQVDDEEDEHWQEALGLAMTHAPDHPLLTPKETPFEASEDDELDRRTDQMLSMLESGDDEDEAPRSESAEDMAGLGDDPDEPGSGLDTDVIESTADRGEDDELGEDVDLADLSNRLDDPNAQFGGEDAFGDDDEDFEFGGFDEDDSDVPESTEADPKPDREGAALYDLDQKEEADMADSRDVSTPSGLELERGIDGKIDSDSEPEPEPDDDKGVETEKEPSADDEFTLDFESSSDQDSELDEVSVQDQRESDPEDARKDEPGDGLSLDLDDDLTTDLEAEAEELSADVEEDAEKAEEVADDGQAVFDIDDDALDTDDAFGVESDEPELESTEDRPVGGVEDGEDDAESDSEAELSDEDADVKLDLARAYISVDLADSARTILEEVISGGSPEKQDEARKLLEDL
jgi:pilus assembly protein FimV